MHTGDWSLNTWEIDPETVKSQTSSNIGVRLVQKRWEIGPEQMGDWSRTDGRLVQNRWEIGPEQRD